MNFRIELESDNRYKIMYHNEKYDLWLTWDISRFKSKEEANKAIKRIKVELNK